MASNRPQVTGFLRAAKAGDRDAIDDLLASVRDNLHQMATRLMRRRPFGHAIRHTAFFHQAHPQLMDQRRVNFEDSAHVLGSASSVMRLIRLNHTRQRIDDVGGDCHPMAITDFGIARDDSGFEGVGSLPRQQW